MRPYTLSELKYIEDYHHKSRKELAYALDRTPTAIQNQIDIMRREGKLKPSGRKTPRPFTESEISYIREHYKTKGVMVLAKELNRSRNVIGNKYRQLVGGSQG